MNAKKKSKTAHPKVWDVKGILQELEKQNMMNDDLWYFLEYCGVELDEDEIKLLNSRQQPIGENMLESSSGLEDLAQTINFYSPTAYDYVRDTMKLNLPHPQLVRKTFVHTNGKPGYLQEMLDLIKHKVNTSAKSPPCSLTVATMRLNWNEKADIGCWVDFGGPEQCDTESKEVLLFLVTFLNENLNIPVGFFVVARIDQFQMTNMIIGCLELLHETGVQIVALSAELDWTVFRAAKLLGCSFKPQDLKNTFKHPITKEPVALFLDPSKSIEYIRLALQANSPMTLLNTRSPPINWSHVERFMEIVKKKNEHILHDALNESHINFRGEQKGKVACWIMSNSLAKCGQVISQKLNAPEIQSAKPTIDFIEKFNKVYDILSSRAMVVTSNPNDNPKSPLKADNFDTISSFFKNVENYMNNVKGKKGNMLIQSESPGEGMGYIGLLVCMRSAVFLYGKLVLTNQLNMLPLHKFSLEHIELIMNNIRAEFEVKYYNDPKSRYVKYFFETLIQDVNRESPEQKLKEIKKLSMLQNYSAVETINVTACRASIFDCDHIVHPKVSKDHDKTFKLIYSAPEEVWSFTNPIDTYVAGFVASFLFKVVTCETCNGALLANKKLNKRASIDFHDDFGCVLPSRDVVQVCEKAEWFIQDAIKTSHTLDLKAKNLYKPILVNRVLESFVSTEIFDSIIHHQYDQGPTENHIVHLIRAIAEVYIDVRFRHLPVIKSMTGCVPDRYKHKPSYFITGSAKQQEMPDKCRVF